MYRNLLGREVAATDAGIVYWVGELRTGRTTPGAVIGNIIYAAMQADLGDWEIIRYKVLAADQAMQFDGEFVFPSTGSVLAEVRDTRGSTIATYIGTETNGVPGLPLREYRIETDQGRLRVTKDPLGRPTTMVFGSVGYLVFQPQARGVILSICL